MLRSGNVEIKIRAKGKPRRGVDACVAAVDDASNGSVYIRGMRGVGGDGEVRAEGGGGVETLDRLADEVCGIGDTPSDFDVGLGGRDDVGLVAFAGGQQDGWGLDGDADKGVSKVT